MDSKTARNLYERKLENVKRDYELMEYIVEMFTTDDDGVEHPELVKFHSHNNRITFSREGSSDWRDDEFVILVCNYCGKHEVADLAGCNTVWEQRYCWECEREFVQIADCKHLEWE